MKLKDQVAWITGGAQGIGKAVALRLAGEGAHLVLTDVDDAAVQATASQIAQEKGVQTLGIKANVVQFSDCEKVVDQSLDKNKRRNGWSGFRWDGWASRKTSPKAFCFFVRTIRPILRVT